ncbi:L-aspartate oxidase [Sutcliffiella deserti]|uniref:L-aspartate oxidase n=1 Tax=Sutcliffiella deserti TaxID=2875501 RepID=UPI001CBD053B|nr:L-aspartate oxidase [Sutcliffiella deserti]
MSHTQYDVIVVGSGMSALLTANYLSKHMNVMVFTKSGKHENNSFLAQGGVAGAIAKTDSWNQHYMDTLIAGCDHNNKYSVQLLTKQGPAMLQEIIDNGMKFDEDPSGNLSLGMEGAHSMRRILHAGGDQTGKKIMKWLHSQLKESVTILEHETVVNLLVDSERCYGVKTLNTLGQRRTYRATHVVFATGGAGGLYSYTSNNNSVTGMALALAYRVGATLTDLEFMQFHPTMLRVGDKAVGLISEAVRGEGAYLMNNEGKSIMSGVHPLNDLAPRDIVSRVIFNELDQGREVFLNIEHVRNFEARFPTITQMCSSHGINLANKLLPVVPGAHFFMGGIETNENGETSIEGLYAVGEVACNGVHGANRLASNSLLEAIVFSKKLAEHLLNKESTIQWMPTDYREKLSSLKRETIILPAKEELQKKMMKYAGIVRNKNGLLKLISWLKTYQTYWESLDEIESSLPLEKIELIYMLQVSYLIASSALNREESRGAHFRLDFPYLNENWKQKRIMHQKKQNISCKSVLTNALFVADAKCKGEKTVEYI